MAGSCFGKAEVQAEKGRDTGKSLVLRLLGGYHRPYEARAGWERLLPL